MAKAKYLTDADNNKIYPVGHTKAVYDETGTVLEDRLKKSEDKVNKLKNVALSGDYNDLTNKPTSMKPTNHASTSDTYGKGDSTNYGHVKLSSSTNSTSGTSSGEAATPSAVKAAYDLANGKADAGHTHSYNDLTSKPSLAPSNAERNVIVGVQKNGADISPDSSRKVNIIVPTTASDIGAASSSHSHTPSQVGLGNVPNVSTNGQTPTFSEATTRANIISGETLATLFGKIKKWFTDLKTVAWTGSYADLTDKPTSMTPTSHTHTKSEITDFPTSMTPTSHATNSTTYGAAYRGSSSLRARLCS